MEREDWNNKEQGIPPAGQQLYSLGLHHQACPCPQCQFIVPCVHTVLHTPAKDISSHASYSADKELVPIKTRHLKPGVTVDLIRDIFRISCTGGMTIGIVVQREALLIQPFFSRAKDDNPGLC